MNYVLLCFAALVVAGIRFRPRPAGGEYIDADSTMPVKGAFILLVFMSHFIAYIPRIPECDGRYLAVRGFLGQMIVVPFLFYSGYGVCESIRRKGESYLRSFPVRRILKVAVQFAIAVSIYVLAAPLTGLTLQPGQIMLAFLGWTSAGNSNWYVFSIVLLYALTWISFISIDRKDDPRCFGSLAILSGLTLLLIDVLSYCRPDYVYNTLFAYVAGCWFSVSRRELQKFVSSPVAYALALAAGAVAFCMLRMEWRSTAVCETAAVVFALVLAAASMRIRLSSPVLSFCGRHLFGIYVFQRLPMWVFKGTAIASNRYVYFLSCLGATIAISVVFDMAFSRLWKIAASRFRTRKSLPAGSGDNRAVAEVSGTKIAENGKKPLYVKPAGREWNGWSIMDDRKLTVDMICSLGGDCIAASQQKLRGLRPYALPFDWCFADGETAVVNLARQLRCRFAGMALKENLRPIQGIKNGYKDIATGYNFIHHFKSAIEEPGEYERFREVFDRRVNRLVEGIERSSEILFIVSRVYRLHTGCLREFGKVCHELWPGKRFHFILATYNSNESVVQHDGEMMVVRIARDRTSYDVKEKVFEWSFLDNVKLR